MRRMLTVLILLLSSSGQADILHLRDGSRQQGKVISRSADAVVFRALTAGGNFGPIQKVPASDILRVEITKTTAQSPADANGPIGDEDYEQMLREGFELLDDGDLPAAVRAMQRAVIRAPDEHIPELDQVARRWRDTGLAYVLADARLRLANERGDGRTFDLDFATEIERPVLARLLEKRQNARLTAIRDGRTVADWAADRDAYEELQPDARDLVADAARAAALIRTRLRLDPRLNDNPAARRSLLQLQADLTRLAADVSSMPGYTAPQRDDGVLDPAERVAHQLAQEHAAASQPAAASASTTTQPTTGDHRP